MLINISVKFHEVVLSKYEDNPLINFQVTDNQRKLDLSLKVINTTTSKFDLLKMNIFSLNWYV
jgi:hypothetical protein